MVMTESGGENLMALESRLWMTCIIRSLSQVTLVSISLPIILMVNFFSAIRAFNSAITKDTRSYREL